MSLTALLVPTYTQMLKTLSNWLDKANEQLLPSQAQDLLSARLAPDMFPLSTQIRFTCVQAQEAVFRLKGEVFPESLNTLLEEGRAAVDQPGSMDAAQARISQTLELVNSLKPNDLDMSPDAPLVHSLPNGMIFDLTAEQYARDWTLPQFYFHLMTAYAILRNAGVSIGKADYVPHMFPYLRPDSMPKG